MGLRTYKAKRHFDKTPEPSGGELVETAGRLYVIQKHAARRLHYDFRLEDGGVLKSWAVPKGPSLDPSEKRLAVQVEDHPLAYGGFEGEIPAGEYGAGSVLLWDRGRWEPEGDAAQGLRRGKLVFRLFGRKLQGRFALVRMSGPSSEGGKNWLLIKEKNQESRPLSSGDILAERPESVLPPHRASVWTSHRAGRRAARPRLRRRPALDPSKLKGARRAPLPDFIAPQLCTSAEEAPAGGDWLNELKFDGYRILCRLEDGTARLLTRRANDWSANFPTLKKALEGLPARSAWLDGEAVVLDEKGRPSFQALQNALSGPGPEVLYCVFDLLSLDGWDLRGCGLLARKSALAALLDGQGPPLRYADHVQGGGPEFFGQACRLGLEGIVSKRRDASYASARTRQWLKVKCFKRQEFVVVGYTRPKGSRSGFGALLLGVHDKGRLRYAGRVGTGFDERTLRSLYERLSRLQVQAPPVEGAPAARDAHWTRPELVAEVAFSEWTSDGVLRQPSFVGLRADKPACEVVPESPRPPRLTHPERVVYERQGLTKRDLAAYYEAAAERMLPLLRRRPLSLVRCPEGRVEKCFFQKHIGETFPPAVKRTPVHEGGRDRVYGYVDDPAGLIGLVQMNVLEIHPWGSTIDALEQPDTITFDLDPAEDVPWADTVSAAKDLRARLEALGLSSFVKTTGGKGLHVVVPVEPELGWDAIKGFARAVAEAMAREEPKRFTCDMAKAGRTGKIFVDYLRNGRGATAVAAYSTRARPDATVSTPLSWAELTPRLDPAKLNVRSLPARL